MSRLDVPELPREFQDAFEVARLAAELDYATRAERIPYHPQLSEALRDPRFHLPILIQQVAFAFCEQARNACREGHWTVGKVCQATEIALPSICEHYFNFERGNCSSEELSRARKIYIEGIKLDPRYKVHVSECEQLAMAPESKRRGRRTRFTNDQLKRASALKDARKTNNEAAKILYQTSTPTPAQRRSVSTVLKQHSPKLTAPSKK